VTIVLMLTTTICSIHCIPSDVFNPTLSSELGVHSYLMTARTSKLIGRLRGMDRESASTVLATPLAQELLRSSPLAHLAYIGRDGYPRVIPTGYVWKGGSSWCALRTTRRKCGASDLVTETHSHFT